jgi:serine/threonine-protein kinase HipA
MKLSQTLKDILQVAVNAKRISREDIEAEVGIKRQTANKYIKELVDSGRLKAVSEGASTSYKSVEPSSKMQEFYFLYDNGKLFGFLGFTKGKFQFSYSNNHLLDDFMDPISLSLPIRNEMTISTSLFPALEAMLPEGIDKEILQRKSGTAQEFYMFENLSTDDSDILFSRTRLDSLADHHVNMPSYISVKDAILDENGGFPCVLPHTIDIDEEILFPPEVITEQLAQRIGATAMSGYQHKFKIHIDNSGKRIVHGDNSKNAASYFMKPYNKQKADPQSGHYFPHIAVNEHLHMVFAKEKLGFDVPYTALCKNERHDEYSYVIKYFNRHEGYRYSLDEVSTLMGLDSETKYNTSAERMFDAIKSVLPKESERLRMLAYFFYSYVISHEDMHTKNLAVINERGKCVASPLYDIAATGFYQNAYGFDTHIPVDGKRNNVTLNDFMGLAKRLSISTASAKSTFSDILQRYTYHMPEYIEKMKTLDGLDYWILKKKNKDGGVHIKPKEKKHFADVLMQFHSGRVAHLAELGYYKQLRIPAYTRTACRSDIVGMVNQVKIIDKLSLFEPGITEDCFDYLKEKRMADTIDIFKDKIVINM